MVAPLLAVQLLFRSKPELSSLLHVVATVSTFVDSSIELPLDEACKLESVALLQRIWDSSEIYTTKTNLSDGKWSLRKFIGSDRHYRQHIFTAAMNEAMYRHNLEIGKWLLDHFEECTIEVSDALGDIPVEHLMKGLQFFYENDPRLSTRRSVVPSDSDRPQRSVYWGGFAMSNVIYRRRSDLVWWLHRHCPGAGHNLESALVAAVKIGDIYLAEWLLSEGADWPTRVNLPLEMAEKGDLPVLQWLLGQEDVSISVGLVIKAAKNGHYQVVRWLVDRNRAHDRVEVSFAVHSAAVHGHLKVAKYLREQESSLPVIEGRQFHAELLQRLAGLPEKRMVPARTMTGAARNGHLDVVKWLYSEYGADSVTDLLNAKKKTKNSIFAMDVAAGNGHLEVLQFLHELDRSITVNTNSRKRKRRSRQVGPTCTKRAMDKAAGNGFLNVVQWLHGNRQEGCSTSAMDTALSGGHLEMVKWLHNERSEGCTSAAMDGAARNGHLQVIQWLHNNVNGGCTTEALDGAAANGHFAVVKWLHLNRSEGCTTKAMDGAAARGSLDIVKWLHKNREEGCTAAAMALAVRERHLRVAQWLHFNRAEGCSNSALDAAADHAYFDGFLFLHSQCKMKCTAKTALLTHNHGTPEIHAWILENYPEFQSAVENDEDEDDE
ncbi:putative ankyrin repeat domain-containing protein [Phytophthora infestans]|uniref:Putative ankyrin repeat domain-containing protein n=1 Tax=Phytophthora infestans TaxID=4787 RepID=A0A8S9TYX0_PHYIN|nr:putative ankyrin repeat domain-containing protein [Phytophthora infestans]